MTCLKQPMPLIGEAEARQMVEAQHGRKLGSAPGGRAFVFGWGAFAVLYFLGAVHLAQISEWIALGVGAAVGGGFYWEGYAKQKEMRADLKRLLGR